MQKISGVENLIVNPRLRYCNFVNVDVVEPNEPEQFQPQIKDGKLFGRGAYDMKFAVACYLNLLLELGSKLSEYNFGIMLVSDEELGGFHGTGKLVEQGWPSEFCFLPSWHFDHNL